MRVYLAISVVVHVVVMLWLLIGPGARALNPASTEPIMVDLVPPKDAEQNEEQSKPEQPKPDQSNKPDQSKMDPSKMAPPQPDSSNDPRTAAEKDAQDKAAAAARLAQLMGLQNGPELNLSGVPSDIKANLTGAEVAGFKAQIRKCWAVPKGVPNAPDFKVLMRVALSPEGRLVARPELESGPTYEIDAALALRDRAAQALQRCQPYAAALPADKYQEWKVLDVTFGADGPSGVAGPTDAALR
jgi:hypothetical protein